MITTIAKRFVVLSLITITLAACEDPREAPEVPDEGALPLSQVIAATEALDLGTIFEVEFEDGVWEIELLSGDEVVEIEVDPFTGAVIEDD